MFGDISHSPELLELPETDEMLGLSTAVEPTESVAWVWVGVELEERLAPARDDVGQPRLWYKIISMSHLQTLI
jgi:hypothetical protein